MDNKIFIGMLPAMWGFFAWKQYLVLLVIGKWNNYNTYQIYHKTVYVS